MEATKPAEIQSTVEIVEVASTNIARIGYDAAKQLLFVKFVGSGWYAYRDVPADKHKEFLESESKGKHFHAKIRPNYLFAKVLADENDVPNAPPEE